MSWKKILQEVRQDGRLLQKSKQDTEKLSYCRGGGNARKEVEETLTEDLSPL